MKLSCWNIEKGKHGIIACGPVMIESGMMMQRAAVLRALGPDKGPAKDPTHPAEYVVHTMIRHKSGSGKIWFENGHYFVVDERCPHEVQLTKAMAAFMHRVFKFLNTTHPIKDAFDNLGQVHEGDEDDSYVKIRIPHASVWDNTFLSRRLKRCKMQLLETFGHTLTTSTNKLLHCEVVTTFDSSDGSSWHGLYACVTGGKYRRKLLSIQEFDDRFRGWGDGDVENLATVDDVICWLDTQQPRLQKEVDDLALTLLREQDRLRKKKK